MNLRLLVFLFPLILFSQNKKYKTKDKNENKILNIERRIAKENQKIKQAWLRLMSSRNELLKINTNWYSFKETLSEYPKKTQLMLLQSSYEGLLSKIFTYDNQSLSIIYKKDSLLSFRDSIDFVFNDIIDEKSNKIRIQANLYDYDLKRIEEERDSLIQAKDEEIRNLQSELDDLKSYAESLQIEAESLKEDKEIVETFDSGSFLNNLYHGKEEINNQTFYLSFEGILNIEECTLPYGSGYGSNDNYYDNRNRGVFYSFLPVEDLIVNFYKSDLSKIDSFNDEDDCNCADDPIVYKKNNRLKGVLPELSFLKGKLVTINTFSDQLEVDYLFSTSIDDVSKGVLYKKMHFRFTREAGNGKEEETFFVPIRVINGRVFLLLTNSFLKKLDFGFHFTSFPCPEIDDGDYGVFDENYNSKDPWMVETIEGETKKFWYDPGYYSSDTFDNVRCLRPDLIQVFKKKDNFNSEQKIVHLKQSDIFLFELIEK